MLAVAVALCASIALAQAFRPPPAPTRWVTDNAGFLSASTRAQLDARLQKYQRDTGRQVVVWIGRTLGDNTTVEEWAVRTFEAWGIGKQGKDDGVAVFIFAGDRKLRIEVGYGLEGDLPDVIANRIIQEAAVPRLRAGDPDGAVVATVDSLLRTLGGETSPPPAPAPVRRPSQPEVGIGQLVLYGIIGVVLLILFITNPRLAFFLLWSLMSSGGGHRGGGGFGGGGGFRGGGGRSGGGGASGSW